MNILIVKTSAIGDVTHTLPALNALRRQYPEAHIAWLVEEAAADVVQGHKALNRVLVSKRKQWAEDFRGLSFPNAAKEVYSFICQLRDTEYDWVIDFQSLLKSAVFVTLAKAKRKIGFDKGMEHAEYSYLFLNERIPPVSMEHHAVLRDLMLLESLGIKTDQVVFDFPIDDTHRNQLKILLNEYEINSAGPLIAINPVAKWETKLWDSRNFAGVADQLITRYRANIIFTGGADDSVTIQNIISHMAGPAINLAAKTTIKTLAALLERVDFLVSTDTGPMHLAAALGTPVVAIFGPTAPWRTGPYGPNHQVIRAELTCSPCFKRQCPTTDCMKQITAAQVLDGIKKLGILE
ncbi:lipopolysaccharide heptosyltransferase I [Thermodesulfobacteriota bacterium]